MSRFLSPKHPLCAILIFIVQAKETLKTQLKYLICWTHYFHSMHTFVRSIEIGSFEIEAKIVALFHQQSHEPFMNGCLLFKLITRQYTSDFRVVNHWFTQLLIVCIYIYICFLSHRLKSQERYPKEVVFILRNDLDIVVIPVLWLNDQYINPRVSSQSQEIAR